MAQSIPLVEFGLDPLIDLNFHLWGSGQRWIRVIPIYSRTSLVQVRLGKATRRIFLKPESCKTTMPIVSARCQNPISIFGWVQTDTQRRQEAVECAVNGAQPVNRMTVK